MMYKKLHVLAILCLISQAAWPFFQVDFEQKYQKTVEQFSALVGQDAEIQMHQISPFFLNFHQPYQQIIKQLHHDIQVLNKEIKKLQRHKESVQSLVLLHDQLKKIYSFVKKHRLQYEVVTFHEVIKNRWNVLFQAVAQGKDIDQFLKDFNIEHIDYESLRHLVKIVNKDLRQIETYEYRLHTDWIDVKLANYVLKIELIRLRNAILFHPLYKKTKLKLSSSYPR